MTNVDLILLAQISAAKRKMLPIWTVYDRPRDHPDVFVARLSEVGRGNAAMTDVIVQSASLDELRAWFADAGLTCLPRYREDDPVIVEVWL